MHLKFLLLLSGTYIISGETNETNTIQNNTLSKDTILNDIVHLIPNSTVECDDFNIEFSLANTSSTINSTCSVNNTNEYFQYKILNNIYTIANEIYDTINKFINSKVVTAFSLCSSFVLIVYVFYLKNKKDNQSLRDFMTSNLYRIPMTTTHKKRENVNNIVTI